MKHCPKCNRYYPDETIQFCLEDGTPLNQENYETSDLSKEQETVVLTNKPEPMQVETIPEPTKVDIKPEPIRVDINRPERIEREEFTPVIKPQVQAIPEKSNTPLLILLTALSTLLVLGLIGFGAYSYLNKEDSVVAQKNTEPAANIEDSSDNTKTINKNSKEKTVVETPEKEIAVPKPKPKPSISPEETSVPEVGVEETRKGVSRRLTSWKSQGEAINLENYMSSYADRVDYYNKNGVSKSFVRSDKQNAFNKYDSMKINLSNINITTSEDGRTANVLLDKEWNFSGEGDNSSGKVRQRLKMKKVGEDWLITSEKDLKVYYINR